jgi:hypothetical protein
MPDFIVEQYPYLLAIVVLGSLVDILQFSWIIKRRFRVIQTKYRNKIKRELLLEHYEKEKK